MEPLRNKTTVLATFADDELIAEDGKVISVQKGGPALYIEKALQGKCPFLLKGGPKLKVQILLKRDGEVGRVVGVPNTEAIKFSEINTPLLLISSILDEFNLDGLEGYKGKVFLDIQGYVRDGNDFGKKKKWIPERRILENIFCLKGTKEELKSLSKDHLEFQKKKVLISTDGERGSEVFAFGEYYIFKPEMVIRPKDTIGAGDTFMANFILCFSRTGSIVRSAKYATQKTELFLSRKGT